MEAEPFQVIDVSDDAAQLVEQMGTKRKFWYRDINLGMSLFKCARDNTGEDWAEVVACEIADTLGFPHATYKLALWQGRQGVVSPEFLNYSAERGKQFLLHGNELLMHLDPAYPGGKRYRLSDHTLDIVLDCLDRLRVGLPAGFDPPAGVRDGTDCFIGYLVFDALIGNTDRHHENWGIVGDAGHQAPLAPTFDHASSFGCHLTDDERRRRLETTDSQYTVEAFTRKARSALYDEATSLKPMTTIEVIRRCRMRRPEAVKSWCQRLDRIHSDGIRAILYRIPEDRISRTAVDFAERLVMTNHSALRSIED